MKTIVRWLSLAVGIFLIGYGVWLLFNPLLSLLAVALIMGISVLTSGICEIIAFFSWGKENRSPWMIASGILSIVLSIWLLSVQNRIVGMALVLPWIFAIWILSSGIMRIAGSISLMNNGQSGGALLLITGILGTIGGFVFLVFPQLSALSIGIYVSCLVIYEGVSAILYFWNARKSAA